MRIEEVVVEPFYNLILEKRELLCLRRLLHEYNHTSTSLTEEVRFASMLYNEIDTLIQSKIRDE